MRARRGFTLVELCFVVGIIGILASIAIPNFIIYQQQAKATEATINLETIAYLEQVALLETEQTVGCEAQPKEIPRATKGHFVITERWKDLGFAPTAAVWFQYEVQKVGTDGFVAIARGDLDGDGEQSEYRIDSKDMRLTRKNPTE